MIARGQSRRTTMFAMSGLAPIAAMMLQCRDRSKSAISGHCRHSLNGRYGILDRVTASVRLDVDGPDDVAPLLGLIRDEPSKVAGREREHVATQVGKPRLELGIGKASVDLLVEQVDYFDRRALGCRDAVPTAGLVARHELSDGRDVRQRLRARRGGDCERA